MAPELTTTSRQPAAASSSAWAASVERKASSGVPSARTSVDEPIFTTMVLYERDDMNAPRLAGGSGLPPWN